MKRFSKFLYTFLISFVLFYSIAIIAAALMADEITKSYLVKWFFIAAITALAFSGVFSPKPGSDADKNRG